MIDIHSHIIYEMDDGAPAVEESVKMLQQAREIGIKTIIATPHFQEKLFGMEGVMEKYHVLLDKARELDMDFKLGCEAFINPFIPEVVKNEKRLLLNGSRYFLLELPYDAIPIYTYETIYKLQLQNILPIIAHPERNMNLLQNFNEFVNFLERGCYMQIDAGSIVGAYGSSVQEFAKRLIKLNMAHFVASDAHCANDYKTWFKQAYEKVCGWAGREYADKLFNHNPQLVLDNIQESIYEMI